MDHSTTDILEFHIKRLFVICSLLVNSLLIYLILSDKIAKLGKYSYLLILFAIFDITISLSEIFISVITIQIGKVFLLILKNGPIYWEDLALGHVAITFRTSFIAISYSLLTIHFVFRYLIIHKPSVIEQFFKPIGLFLNITFVISVVTIWNISCLTFLIPDKKIRSYVHDDLWNSIGIDSFEVPFLSISYVGFDKGSVKTLIGMGLVCLISISLVLSYLILGFKIHVKLKKHYELSEKTRRMHQQLMKALYIQTSIPILINLIPCSIAWFAPFFNLNIGNYMRFLGVMTFTSFPVVDPVAIIFFIPAFRKRITRGIYPKPRIDGSHDLRATF